jgi:hypothetical protein
MGLNYNYLLYFSQAHLWNVLQSLGDICDTEGMQPTTIQFPDHDQVIPLMSDWGKKDVFLYNQPELQFAISMNFEEDEAIADYLYNRDGDQFDRSPPEDRKPRIHSIGFISLTVFTDLSQHYGFTNKPNEMVLFKFGTTGTKMSLLFSDSTSIRKTFIKLLEDHHGIAGIFDWEIDYGELFWFKGRHYQFSLSNNFLLPEEIELELARGY